MNTAITRYLFAGLLTLGCLTAADRASKPAASTPSATSEKTAAGKVDLNTADAATLESLPGVGPEIAREIIAARPFKSVAELEQVRGIGPVKMKALKSHVTVSKAAAARAARTTTARTDTPASTARTTTSRSDTPVSTTARESRSTRADVAGRVNLNTASRAELEALPEIGPVKAQAIIEGRPYSSPEDVMRVKGIKEGTFEAIKDKITVR